jgi:hypothetical protein
MRTFSIFIHTADSTVPTLLIKAAADQKAIREFAKRELAESASCLVVEVREEDRLLFALDRNGVAWASHESGLPA